MPSDAVRSGGTGRRVRWGQIGWLSRAGGGLGECRGGGRSEEKLICLQLLSLIACACLTGSITVNHRGSTRLLCHTTLPHHHHHTPNAPPPTSPSTGQIISFTSGAWWESLQSALILKPLGQAGRCLRICFARGVLLKGGGDPNLAGSLSSLTLRKICWNALLRLQIPALIKPRCVIPLTLRYFFY